MALSKMDAEYITLSQSMQDLSPLQEKVFKKEFIPRCSAHFKAYIETVKEPHHQLLIKTMLICQSDILNILWDLSITLGANHPAWRLKFNQFHPPINF